MIVLRHGILEQFGQLQIGDTFIYTEQAYMKIEKSPNETKINAVCLEDGRVAAFHDSTLILQKEFVCKEVGRD